MATKVINNKVYLTEDIMRFENAKNQFSAGVEDPTTTALDGRPGDLTISVNGSLYQKLDSGLSTNWQLVGSGGSGPSSQWSGTAPGNIYYDQGNVGIGTTTPGFRLQVMADNTNVAMRLNGSSTRYRSDFERSPTGLKINAYDDGSSTYQNFFLDGSNIGFAIAGTEMARISTDGKLGIGTNSPSSFLDVVGDGNFNNNQIHNVSNPSLDQDVATKIYVDNSSIPNKETQTYLTGTTDYTLLFSPIAKSLDLHTQTGSAAPILLIEDTDYTISGITLSILATVSNNDLMHIKYTYKG